MYSECIATCKAFLFELAQESYWLESYLFVSNATAIRFSSPPSGFFFVLF